MAILDSLQDFVELQGYGLSVSYGPLDLTYGLNALATPVSVRTQTRPEVYALG